MHRHSHWQCRLKHGDLPTFNTYDYASRHKEVKQVSSIHVPAGSLQTGMWYIGMFNIATETASYTINALQGVLYPNTQLF
jgi:hypothetical protein